ncbi:MAG: hypothetical protein PHV05_07150 [Candidatus Riflebacteria bacterium]|nr:hypothetical protein [Candidatus Riflebacteria bacterium]
MNDIKIIAADEQQEISKKIIEQWQRTGAKLEKIRAEELQNFIYDPELVDAMLELGLLHAKPRFSSGLVEMQRYFSKWRKQIASSHEAE